MPLDALLLDHAPVAGLMRLWSKVHWSSGDGMMPGPQLLEIYRLAATWPVKGDIVELGAWVGLTTSYLATACRVRGAGKVHAVDTFDGTKEGGTKYTSVARFGGGTLDAFRAHIVRAGVTVYIEEVIHDTTAASRQYGGAPIRMLLIDADHSYGGVRAEFSNWFRHVAPGGLIVFHDYNMPEVARFVDGEVRGDPRVVPSPGPVVSNVIAVTKKPRPRAHRLPERWPPRPAAVALAEMP